MKPTEDRIRMYLMLSYDIGCELDRLQQMKKQCEEIEYNIALRSDFLLDNMPDVVEYMKEESNRTNCNTLLRELLSNHGLIR